MGNPSLQTLRNICIIQFMRCPSGTQHSAHHHSVKALDKIGNCQGFQRQGSIQIFSGSKPLHPPTPPSWCFWHQPGYQPSTSSHRPHPHHQAQRVQQLPPAASYCATCWLLSSSCLCDNSGVKIGHHSPLSALTMYSGPADKPITHTHTHIISHY